MMTKITRQGQDDTTPGAQTAADVHTAAQARGDGCWPSWPGSWLSEPARGRVAGRAGRAAGRDHQDGAGDRADPSPRLRARRPGRGRGTASIRTGHTGKTVQTGLGLVRLSVPRDRADTFEPAVVPKRTRRVGGFDEAMISLHAKGLTTGRSRRTWPTCMTRRCPAS
jgi:Transposase, Mutator family